MLGTICHWHLHLIEPVGPTQDFVTYPMAIDQRRLGQASAS